MAEETAADSAGGIEEKVQVEEEMNLEACFSDDSIADNLNGAVKPNEKGVAREREEEEEEGATKKKPKVEKSPEEEQLEKLEAVDGEGWDEKEAKEMEAVAVHIGPKVFFSSEEMLDYFYKLLHHWPLNLDVNKYEHMLLLDLLKKGHADAAKKIGEGIQAFQVRYHPLWNSRRFFLLREDGSVDDFSFRKSVDHILPLPDSMSLTSSSNSHKAIRHHKDGGDCGSGRGYSSISTGCSANGRGYNSISTDCTTSGSRNIRFEERLAKLEDDIGVLKKYIGELSSKMPQLLSMIKKHMRGSKKRRSKKRPSLDIDASTDDKRDKS